MTQFTNVTVDVTANIYFDGKVTSRKVTFSDGEIKTLGIMMIGEYEFATKEKELMEVIAGQLEVLLPNQSQWQIYKTGESFNVPANTNFKVNAVELTDYCCSYIQA